MQNEMRGHRERCFHSAFCIHPSAFWFDGRHSLRGLDKSRQRVDQRAIPVDGDFIHAVVVLLVLPVAGFGPAATDEISGPRLVIGAGASIDDVRPEMDDPKSWDVVRYFRATPAGTRGEGRNLTGGRLKWCAWLAAEYRSACGSAKPDVPTVVF